jgi:septum site-determining protein MinC
MSGRRSLVTIKGRKEGLILTMDDTCAYDAMIEELREKLSVDTPGDRADPPISVRVEAGNRYLSEKQRLQIVSIIQSYHHLQVDRVVSNVMTREEYKKAEAEKQLSTRIRMVRSGQVLDVEGDLFLVGDVNPGGKVSASGSIYILGALRGTAAAGKPGGEENVVIAASVMRPSQLRIGGLISRTGDMSESEMKNDHVTECAYADPVTGKIVIDPLQSAIRKYRQRFRADVL